ncbi:MAG: hypothetical protein KME03_19400, partial [Aphanocapsa lilacina HA4352-LM1]|nr:hypothetical protein [Aphanocapsa lilacina HA4352-LM1]
MKSDGQFDAGASLETAPFKQAKPSDFCLHRLYNKLILGMSIAGVNFYTEQFSGVQPAAQSAFQEDRERL